MKQNFTVRQGALDGIEAFLAEWPSVREIYAYVEGAHHDAR